MTNLTVSEALRLIELAREVVTYLNWLHGVARAILAARARKEGVGR